MTRPVFLALAVMLALTVALALAGPNTRDMSSLCGAANARTTGKSNLTAKAKKPGHVIMLCGRHTSLLKPLKGGDIQGRRSRSAQERPEAA